MLATPRHVSCVCPAKLNLSLAVGRPSADGLHPISSHMVALAFGDRLSVRRLDDGLAPQFDLRFAEDAPRHGVIDWPLESDLTVRAHAAVEELTGRALPVRLRLEKLVPTGAGLGGGSADAAAMIVALDQLFELELTADDDHDLADGLGSDVHFSLANWRSGVSAQVGGTGQTLAPRSAIDQSLVLILPDFACPTGPVYAAFDRLNLGRASMDDLAPAAEPRCFNDLEPAAVDAQPRLGALLWQLRDDLRLDAHVTGSGAACFVLTESSEQSQQLVMRLRNDAELTAVATRALTRSPNLQPA